MAKTWVYNEEEKAEFNSLRENFGIPEYLYGEEFKCKKQKYVIKGINKRGVRKVIIARNIATGQDYYFTLAQVIHDTNYIGLRSWLDKNNLEAFLL